MKKIEEEIQIILDVVEQVYALEVTDMKKKIDNIKRVKVDSIADIINEEKKKGNLKNKKDIVKFIQSIIQD
jgi:hypothetical protein